MNIIKVSDLLAGAKFTEPVYIDDTTLFLPRHIAVTEKDIQRLEFWKVEILLTEGRMLDDEIDNRKNYESIWSFDITETIKEEYSHLHDTLLDYFNTVSMQQRIFIGDIDILSGRILELYIKDRIQLIQYVLSLPTEDKDLVTSSLNCSIYSIIMGEGLTLPKRKMIRLISGALLHDIGMLRVSKEIRNKNGVLNDYEISQMRLHPVSSYKILTEELNFPENTALIALQHHERWDGNGYPRGLKGHDILSESRIVSIADAFEAMVSKRPYREPIIGFKVTKSIIADSNRKFDPDLIKIFIHNIGIYPVGSLVILSNSSICRVIESNSQAPLRPMLLVLMDENGREYETNQSPSLDLSANSKLYIKKVVHMNDILEDQKEVVR